MPKNSRKLFSILSKFSNLVVIVFFMFHVVSIIDAVTMATAPGSDSTILYFRKETLQKTTLDSVFVMLMQKFFLGDMDFHDFCAIACQSLGS